MKIKQDTITGAILYELSNEEVCNSSEVYKIFAIDECLVALLEFVNF